MSPYVEQVGGDHYQAALQHWDVMEEADVAYLEATATKYIARARKKGGAEDLRKAVTYLQKMDGRPTRRTVKREKLWLFGSSNDLSADEMKVIKLILQESFGQPGHIQYAVSELERLIKDAAGG